MMQAKTLTILALWLAFVGFVISMASGSRNAA